MTASIPGSDGDTWISAGVESSLGVVGASSGVGLARTEADRSKRRAVRVFMAGVLRGNRKWLSLVGGKKV